MPTKVNWAIILCKCSGAADDDNAKQYFTNFFTDGQGGAVDYWADISYQSLDLRDSAVFGWFELPVTSEQILHTTREDAIKMGIAAARSAGVQIDQYSPKLVFVREPFVGGSVQIGGQSGAGASGGNVLIDQGSLRASFILHEMGHGHGLDHTRYMDGTHYGSPYCLMSAELYGGTDPRYLDAQFGPCGPGLCSPYTQAAGWLPVSSVVQIPTVSNGLQN